MTALAAALLDQLEPADLDRLATLLAPRLADRQPAPAGVAAYTIRSLAAELTLSEKTIRGAIHRGELAAVRRGTRYLIAGDAARAWATPPAAPARGAARAARRRARAHRPLHTALEPTTRKATP